MIYAPGNEHTFAFPYIEGQMLVFDTLSWSVICISPRIQVGSLY